MIVKILFFLYHSLTTSGVRSCRFEPTCSQYSEDALAKYGPLKGSILTLKRIASCHPFTSRPFYDPA